MNKNMYVLAITWTLAISSNIIVAGPWSWIKDRMQSVWITYQRWNIPRPHLIKHQILNLDGKKCEEFRYDISSDNQYMGMLRKQLRYSGICLSNDYDIDAYKKYIQQFPIPQQYIENGFDINLDNSISGCMGRLFTYITTALMQLDMDNLYAQIVWELENGLPQEFDTDSNGQMFIDVIKKAFPERIQKQQALLNVGIGKWLYFWRTYSLRFRNNKGLMRAIVRYPRVVLFG